MPLWISLVLLGFLLLGAPLFSVIAASAMVGFYYADLDLSIVAIEFNRLSEMPILLAIPLFTFSGYLLSESGAPKRLVTFTESVLGWMPGGLVLVSLCACALFTAFTGASGVTIIALGALLYPALVSAGYDNRFSLGLVTTSGSLGMLFAPSLPLILYAVVAQQMSIGRPVNIDDLFLAGIFPGLLMLLLLFFLSRKQLKKQLKTLSTKKRLSMRKAIQESAWELPLPFIILGGIYGGILAVSEAAAITAFYVLFVTVVVRREVSLKELSPIVRESMKLVGGIMVILGVSLASTNLMIDTEVPTKLFEWVQQFVHSKWTFLIFLTLFLLALGMILDVFSALVIVIPLILPVALSYGVDPIHLGILFLANMQIGYITPPVGMNLFIASYRFNKPVMEIYRSTLPFFFILLIAVLIITFWPPLTLFLVGGDG